MMGGHFDFLILFMMNIIHKNYHIKKYFTI